jgi:hypothetical protein
MKLTLSAAAHSLAEEKARHLINAVATGTSGTVVATGSLAGSVMDWLPVIGVVFGMFVSCALFYKTYLEIKLRKIELARKGLRASDKEPL